MYARTFDGLVTCYVAGLLFYRNDLVSTGLFLALAFGVPVLVRRSLEARNPEPVPVSVSSKNSRA
jgi:Flp pilus assembly protein TadB